MYAMRYPRRMVLKNPLTEQWLMNLKLQGKVWTNYDISIGYSCTGKDPNSKSFWGFSPDPTWRAYSAPWIPPAVTRITITPSFSKSCARPWEIPTPLHAMHCCFISSICLLRSIFTKALWNGYSKDYYRWRRGVVVIATAQLQVQVLFAVCRRFAMVSISDNGPDWK